MDGKHPHTRGVPPNSGREFADSMSIEQIQHLVHLLDGSDVSELELKSASEGTRLVLRKVKAALSHEHQALAPVQTTAASAEPAETKHAIVASWVGTFHAWAKPRGGTLVAVGDHVKVGQLVATIESLNVINEVEAPAAGRVAEILVQEGQPVEYGQTLIVIDGVEGA